MVARVKWQRELWAAANIERQGFTYYLPRIRVNPTTEAYLFSGYMFIGTDGRWRCLTGTFGILSVIMRNPLQPALMRPEEIEAIQAREDVRGFVVLPKKPRFRSGDLVRVSTGVFSGRVGIYQGCSSCERERILLDYLGNHTEVLIAREQLVAA